MEHPSKRRRVERKTVVDTEEVSTTRKIQEETQMLDTGKDTSRGGLPKLVLPPSGDKPFDGFLPSHQEAEPPLEPIDLPRLLIPKIELRQVLAPVASAVNGVVNNVKGVTSVLLQPSPSNADSKNAAPPSPYPTAPGTVQPPAAIAAQDARNSALAVEEKAAVVDTRLPPPPASPASVPPAPNTPSASKPTSIQLQVSGSNSQQVMSSPSTPLPASPAASMNPSAPSSYFTSSPATLGPSAALASHAIESSTHPNSTSVLSTTSSVTSSATFTVTSATTTSIDSALLAALSASRSSEEARAKSVTLPPNSSGSLTGSLISQTTLMTIPSSTGIAQSSASGSNGVGAGAGAGGIGATSNTSGAPTSTSTSGSGSGGGSNTPATPALIGGIVGGISGLVLILLAALLLLRWKKGRLGSGERRTISPPMLQTSAPGNPPQTGTTQRSSTTPIAAAGIFGRFRPSSSQTATTSDTAPSERGFQKISGRKLPSVLTSGGDGYGAAGSSAAAGAGAVAASKGGPSDHQERGVAPGQGPFAGLAPGLRPSTAHSLSGSSFYRDSKGFYGGVVPESTSGSGATEPSGSPTSSSPTFPSPLAVAGGAKDPGNPNRKPTIRPGPARQPVMHEAGTVPPRPPRATPPPPGSHLPRDLLGRSHPSEDGSRTSRFRESTTPP